MAGGSKTVGERMAVLETQMNDIVVPTIQKMDKFLDDNKSGIRTASILDNKIITIVIGGIVAIGIYWLGHGGSL